MARSLSSVSSTPVISPAFIRIKRIKWFLWHGNVVRALDSIEEVEDLAMCAQAGEESSRLQKAIDEFHTYIENNVERIPNFGERRRNREKVSTAFVESTVNQVISKRMVKKQQMRWSRRGAHLLLQVRTRELNCPERYLRRQVPPAVMLSDLLFLRQMQTV